MQIVLALMACSTSLVKAFPFPRGPFTSPNECGTRLVHIFLCTLLTAVSPVDLQSCAYSALSSVVPSPFLCLFFVFSLQLNFCLCQQKRREQDEVTKRPRTILATSRPYLDANPVPQSPSVDLPLVLEGPQPLPPHRSSV